MLLEVDELLRGGSSPGLKKYSNRRSRKSVDLLCRPLGLLPLPQARSPLVSVEVYVLAI